MSEIITHGGKKETYEQFVDKFKQKLTTDDCYTPPKLMEVVHEWVRKEYGLEGAKFLRPFYPGGDYEHFDYTGGVVVDNPPFSCITKIVDFYTEHGIPFFIFAPALSPVRRKNVSIVFIDKQIKYENGACVRTCFITNLEAMPQWRTAPDLNSQIHAVMSEIYPNTRKARKWASNLLDAARMLKICNRGVLIRISTGAFGDPDKETRKNHFGQAWMLPDEVNKKVEEIEHGLHI